MRSKFFMKKMLLVLMVIIWTVPASSQLTLRDCVRAALSNNAELKKTETEAAIVEQDVHQAWGARWPSLDFSGSYRRQSIVPELDLAAIKIPIAGQEMTLFPGGSIQLGLLDNYDFKLTILQPIFTGFRLFNRYQAARAFASGKASEVLRKRSELIFQIESAYADVLKNQKTLEIALSAKRQLEAHRTDIENMMKQGMAKHEQWLRVQVKLSEADLAVTQAENRIRIAKLRLENLMGQKLPKEAMLEPMPMAESVESDPSVSLQKALVNRPELQSLLHAKQAGQAGLKVARGGHFPTLSAFATLGYGKPGLDFIKREWMDYWLVGIGVEWNLWHWGRNRSQVAQAQLQLENLEATDNQVRQAIELDVTQACLMLDDARKRLELTHALADQARESYRVTEQSYRQGVATHSEYLDAQAELTRAQLQQAQAEIDLAVAQANWRRAVGFNISAYQE
ncbi:MAG: TolC family protein [candidate division KSB1 bacterium]|nr:TolC family protein [candidate division KSB1 bacterium]MDZ7335504.1 TolC family protein [candidate division KSB1 bacterium]MDZ7357116.1 TolC family protein [candidate division KSB1 bacterium]MDZ7376235.1 TolC family protein [candidate division KSB1 bacterium]MDZ7401761.1 TolC family protein [candidate division KSB1 bacterium]